MSPARRKTRLGRPPMEDRNAIRSELVTLKLTPPEAAVLDAIVDVRWRELSAEAGGARVELTRSSVIRELIAAEAKRRRIE